MGKPMKDMIDDELAALGWDYVARGADGKAISLGSDKDSDIREAIMEWLGEGWTVSKLFR